MKNLPLNPVGLAHLVTIWKGTEVIRFTTFDRSLNINGVLYQTMPGADVTGIQTPGDGGFINADVVIMAEPNGPIKPGDGMRGALDDWPIEIDFVDVSTV